MNADGRRSAASWVDRCIDGRLLEAVRERGQQVDLSILVSWLLGCFDFVVILILELRRGC